MSYALLSESFPVARKCHRCIWCGEWIEPGTKYRRERSVYDGSMQDHKWHMECDEDFAEGLRNGGLAAADPPGVASREWMDGWDACRNRVHTLVDAAVAHGVAPSPQPEPCPRGADKPEPSCTNRHQCWEPCGELGKSAEHTRVGHEPKIVTDGVLASPNDQQGGSRDEP